MGRILFSLPRHRSFNALKSFYLRSKGAKVGRNVVFYPRVRIDMPLDLLTIGDDVDLALGVAIVLEGSLSIGDRTLIGYKARIVQSSNEKSTFIDKDVWIGAGCEIHNGISIGEGAVVAGGSLLATNVEPFTIVGGKPAKFIKQRN
jgi:acetyltransferase-like isoleucine patch superfamily enzyme